MERATDHSHDVVVIGSGFGGGPLAHSVSAAGFNTLLIERGGPISDNDRTSIERVLNRDGWHYRGRRIKRPVSYCCVGGMSKFFGGNLTRMREVDFSRVEHESGVSPAWPISYHDLERYYVRAERLFRVSGTQEGDPLAPHRSADFPHAPPSPTWRMSLLVNRLRANGVSPFPQALCMDRERIDGGGCDGCNARCCVSRCKQDVEYACIEPMRAQRDASIWTHARALRLVTNREGDRVEYALVRRAGGLCRVYARQFVVSCGAINSSALLLASTSDQHPLGLANSSGLLGRHYMQHYNTELLAFNSRRLGLGRYQKCFSANDFYFGDGSYRYPLGNIQSSGTVTVNTLKNSVVPVGAWLRLVPSSLLARLLDHVLVVSVLSEDLPDRRNAVTLSEGGDIHIAREFVDLRAHHRLIAITRRLLRRSGFDLVIPLRLGVGQSAHYCGTIRFGESASDSVLDPFCQTHDVGNLRVVDASFFPSSSATNPSLTIAAQSLRVADHLCQQLGGHPTHRGEDGSR